MLVKAQISSCVFITFAVRLEDKTNRNSLSSAVLCCDFNL